MTPFNGLGMSMSNLYRLSAAKSRSISPENMTGEKGGACKDLPSSHTHPARELGQGWKVSPYLTIKPNETVTLADIDGPGVISQIWMTVSGHWRFGILRIYWDNQENPSVECPVGDFFASGWCKYDSLSSLAVCVNPGSGFNCYWEMPFQKKCVVTITNIAPEDMVLFYQINYTLTDIPEDCAYFHAQFRRQNPTAYRSVYTILDGVEGKGQYVGTYLAWGVNNNGWWGEGEVKFYLDGDKEFPTICFTGLEDYFCGSYAFEGKEKGQYQDFSTPYAGLHQIIRPDGFYQAQMRFGMYRWHVTDPVRFDENLSVTVQALGWRSGGRFLPLQDDIASVAFWYQTLPAKKFPPLPEKDLLEVI